ncbi:MAG TPA: selenide, water dikinase SelD [Bryobacteraceae bacterium]|nr:selenide, water dikinase SelD [Bryobacteraceae bacterium]
MTRRPDLKNLRLLPEQMFAGGGCHGKLSGEALEQVLCGAASSFFSRPEDAAIVQPQSANLLFSNDLIYLPGLSLFDAGRIAALHSLSDIYASGGIPRWALVTLIVDRTRPLEHGEAVMAGIAEACEQEGVAISGGHTVSGSEAMAGLSAIGTLDGAPLRKTGAKLGDRLFLSKSIGTGLCLAGYRRGLCDDAALAGAMETMLIPARIAAAPAARQYATACTDVTGFGLFGHLAEMLEAPLGALLSRDAIPLLPFAAAPPREIAESARLRNNYEYVTSRVELRHEVPVYRLAALLDPQTNGPLLAAAPGSAAPAMRSAGFAEIGRITDRAGITLR